ncbi:RNA polymerase sigma-70 factor [Mucilaginibacter paludis]|uniref:RNA polymerase, sigma-24 subunit, ECF subfamily n=1 Tax=Mucilaginibacter paludis DSM 18603 TaxID=714943 RepID=H1Y8F0_9SPHI|nr:RNA polymerase sigma-70 factor [Mucilaginibacter paludis]EHQ25868.1 RNA polymerase, sigma-24 subunit, ECF subfamily [Mucilaginibacter paludis DSM 18603]
MINNEIVNERQLLVQLSNHDKEAFSIIYNAYAKKLFRYAVKIIKSTEIAEDTVHDIFVKLWDNASSLQIETSLQAYLYKATYFHLMNLIKRGAVQERFVDEVMYSAAQLSHCTEEKVLFKETLKHVQCAIDSLPPQRKLIFEMGRNEGMSHRQIARELDLADSTVNNQIVKALKTIKEHLLISGSVGILLTFVNFFHK